MTTGGDPPLALALLISSRCRPILRTTPFLSYLTSEFKEHGLTNYYVSNSIPILLVSLQLHSRLLGLSSYRLQYCLPLSEQCGADCQQLGEARAWAHTLPVHHDTQFSYLFKVIRRLA